MKDCTITDLLSPTIFLFIHFEVHLRRICKFWSRCDLRWPPRNIFWVIMEVAQNAQIARVERLFCTLYFRFGSFLVFHEIFILHNTFRLIEYGYKFALDLFGCINSWKFFTLSKRFVKRKKPHLNFVLDSTGFWLVEKFFYQSFGAFEIPTNEIFELWVI